MQPLSALDASFIYLEADHSPMHVGSVYVMDAADVPEKFGYEVFKAHIASRLSCSRIFRQRLVEVPLGLSHPCWINDPDFDLDLHLPRRRLIAPGGRKELMELAAEIFARKLDRSRPLWEFNFVEGIDGVPGLVPGSFALVSKVHHAAIDGVSGAELIAATLDVTPVPRTIPGIDDWQSEEAPAKLSLVANAYAHLGDKARELGKFVAETALGSSRLRKARQVERLDPPPMLFSAPKSPFNVNVTTGRSFWGLDFDFDRIRRLRRAVPGTSVNDIVLSVCAGALRTYLDSGSALPERELVAMAPISVRGEAQKGSMGNQVSAMLVGLATDVEDPLQRLRKIHANARNSKIYSSAMPANRIAEFIPSETAAAAVRLYTRTRLGGRHRPFFNLVLPNVPGPPAPMYLAGARVNQHFGMAPVLDGLGLIIVVFSYGGLISFGLNACARILPDPERLADCFRQSLAELEAAVEGGGPIEKQMTVPPAADISEPDAAGGSPADRLRDAIRELDEAMETVAGEEEA
jgi:WS/DGAT/MGAT family acyltransferase